MNGVNKTQYNWDKSSFKRRVETKNENELDKKYTNLSKSENLEKRYRIM